MVLELVPLCVGHTPALPPGYLRGNDQRLLTLSRQVRTWPGTQVDGLRHSGRLAHLSTIAVRHQKNAVQCINAIWIWPSHLKTTALCAHSLLSHPRMNPSPCRKPAHNLPRPPFAASIPARPFPSSPRLLPSALDPANGREERCCHLPCDNDSDDNAHYRP